MIQDSSFIIREFAKKAAILHKFCKLFGENLTDHIYCKKLLEIESCLYLPNI